RRQIDRALAEPGKTGFALEAEIDAPRGCRDLDRRASSCRKRARRAGGADVEMLAAPAEAALGGDRRAERGELGDDVDVLDLVGAGVAADEMGDAEAGQMAVEERGAALGVEIGDERARRRAARPEAGVEAEGAGV